MGWMRVAAVAVGVLVVATLGGCAVAPAVASKTPPRPTDCKRNVVTDCGADCRPDLTYSARLRRGCRPSAVTAVDPALVPDAPAPSTPYIRAVARQQAGILSCALVRRRRQDHQLAGCHSVGGFGSRLSEHCADGPEIDRCRGHLVGCLLPAGWLPGFRRLR